MNIKITREQLLEICRATRPAVVRAAMVAIGKLVHVPVTPGPRVLTEAEWMALRSRPATLARQAARRRDKRLRSHTSPLQANLSHWGRGPSK